MRDWAFEANWSIPVGGMEMELSGIAALVIVVAVAAVELEAVVAAAVVVAAAAETLQAVVASSSLADEVHEVAAVVE